MSSEQNEQKESSANSELDCSSSSNVEPLEKATNFISELPKQDSPFFYEDEVFRITKKGNVKFGLVVETQETFSGDEDDEDYDDLNKGDIRVSWYPEGDDVIVREDQIGLADRSLMPGDIVRRLVPGKNTQRGFCRDIKLKADVKILGTRQIMKNISSDRLRSVANWAHNSAVCLDSWVGSAKHVDEIAILRASSGAKIEVPSDRWHLFYQPNHRPHTENQHFFIGNVVLGKIRDMLNLKKLTPDLTVPTNKKGTARFTIESIKTQAVYVDWQCKALCDEKNPSNCSIQQPARKIYGKELERLSQINLYDTCLLQLNDRCYIKFSKDDTVIERKLWKRETYHRYKKLLNEQREDMQRLNESGTTAPMSNTSMLEKLRKKFNLPNENERTCKSKKSFHKIDKNKSKSSNISSVSGVDDAEWVSECETEVGDEKGCEDEASDPSEVSNETRTTSTSTKNPGKPYLSYYTKKYCPVVKRSSSSVRKEHNLKDGDETVVEALVVYSTVNVVWQDGTIEEGIPSTQLYPIHHLDSHEYFPGDYVCCTREDINYNANRDYGVVQKVDHLGRTAVVKWFTVYTCLKSPIPSYNGETEVSVYDLKDHPDFQFRVGAMVIRVANFVGVDSKSTAGQVTECLTDGLLKVTWVDGHVSNCWPQDLFEVTPYDNQSEDESGDSWETESENSEIGIQSNSPKLSSSESDFFVNINKAYDQISKLEKLFADQLNETVSVGILRKLIILYKSCRQMDRMMDTNYFHEDNFRDILKRVDVTLKHSATEAKNSFKSVVTSPTVVVELNFSSESNTNEFSPKVVFNTTSTPFKVSQSSSQNSNTSGSESISVSQRIKIVSYNDSEHNTKLSSYKILESDTNVNMENKLIKELNQKPQTSHEIPSDQNSSKPFLPSDGVTDSVEAYLKPSVSNSSTKTNNTDEKESNTNSEMTEETVCVIDKVNGFVESENTIEDPPNKTCLSLTPTRPDRAKRHQQSELLISAVSCLEKASEKCSLKRILLDEDSGHFSRNDNFDSSSISIASPNSGDTSPSEKSSNGIKNRSTSSIVIETSAAALCARLCASLKCRLLLCSEEIERKLAKEEEQVFENLLKEIESDSPLEMSGSEVPMRDLEEDQEEELKPDDIKKTKHGTENVNATESKLLVKDENAMDIDELIDETVVREECFEILTSAPTSHKFYGHTVSPKNVKRFMSSVSKEHNLLRTSLPSNVWVKVFEDRLDLLSVMIEGPKKTPYEDGLFFFDIQLNSDYPKAPPVCHYISFCSDRLNPNLYDDGKVCVSLLGTWSGKGTEVWTKNSTLLQLIVSIQGLILVSEPYFNEAGYEKQKGTQQGEENSRMYNEMVILKFIQATSKIILNPPPLFTETIKDHFKEKGLNMYRRFLGFMELSKKAWENERREITPDYDIPEFPLLPASRGFCLTLEGILNNFYNILSKNIFEISKQKMLAIDVDITETAEEISKASLAVAEDDIIEDNHSQKSKEN